MAACTSGARPKWMRTNSLAKHRCSRAMGVCPSMWTRNPKLSRLTTPQWSRSRIGDLVGGSQHPQPTGPLRSLTWERLTSMVNSTVNGRMQPWRDNDWARAALGCSGNVCSHRAGAYKFKSVRTSPSFSVVHRGISAKRESAGTIKRWHPGRGSAHEASWQSHKRRRYL